MKEIPLWMPKAAPGYYFLALVDDEDYDRVLKAGPWQVANHQTTFYADHHIPGPDGLKRRGCRREHLHRFLMAEHLGPGLEIDHINGNGLDCRRENLRVVTHAQNLQNIQRDTSTRRVPKTSRYRGVCWDKRDQRWVAQISPNRRNIHLGRFESEEEAARVVAAARAKYFSHVNEERHPTP